MALENKAQKTKREALEALPRIVQATQSEVGYTYCTEEIVAWLVKNGALAESDPSNKNETGAVACRATQAGIDKVNAETTKGSDEKMSEETGTEIVIETGVFNKPSRTRTGTGNSKYPFDALEVGQSFFLVGKEAEKMGGTVSSANKRFAVEIKDEAGVVVMRTNRKGKEVPKTEQARKFECYDAELNGAKGARIGRVK